MTKRKQQQHGLSAPGAPGTETNGVVTSMPAELPAAIRDRLLELAHLEPDWDSYGALPASEVAVAATGRLIGRVTASRGGPGVPHEIMPIADGGISLEWRYARLELGLNACPDGGWTYVLVERNAQGRRATEGYDLSDEDALALVVQATATALA